MNRFILMDGAMIHEAISTSRWFSAPSPLFAPLMPTKEHLLAGPILLADPIAREDANKAEVLRLMGAYPHRLHVAFLDSPLGLAELADHLRHYVYFGDDTGEAYGLRIADSRVMACLPQVLLPAQWDAMTRPIDQWHVHDRTGKTYALQLNESRRERTDPSHPLHLTDEQIARSMDEGEPDALLSAIGRNPRATDPRHTQRHYDIARCCIEIWRWHQQQHNPRNPNREVLHVFARRVFASDGAWLLDDLRIRREINAVQAALR